MYRNILETPKVTGNVPQNGGGLDVGAVHHAGVDKGGDFVVLLSRVEVADRGGSHKILTRDGVVHPREEPVRLRDGDGEAFLTGLMELVVPVKGIAAVELL